MSLSVQSLYRCNCNKPLTPLTPTSFTEQWVTINFLGKPAIYHKYQWNPWLGPFYGAIVVPSVTRCRCWYHRCRGHRCAGGMQQWRRATVATPGEWQCKTARSGKWAQHFSNASCSYYWFTAELSISRMHLHRLLIIFLYRTARSNFISMQSIFQHQHNQCTNTNFLSYGSMLSHEKDVSFIQS